MRLMVDSHPRLWSPPELHLLTLCQRLLWVHGILGDNGRAPDAFWDQVTDRVRGQVEEILAPHLQASGKQRWCEKSVTAVNHLDILHGVFPDARVITLYRQMPDMVDSGLRATEQRGDGYDFEPYFAAYPHSRVEALANYWLEKTRAMIDLESEHPHCLRLRYEDLVESPQASLARVAAFIDETCPADWADSVYQQPHQQGPGDTSAYQRDNVQSTSVGCGGAQDFSQLPRRLIRRLNATLTELQYPELS